MNELKPDSLSILSSSSLFSGIQSEQIESLLCCLSATYQSFKKNEFIVHSGSSSSLVGMVLYGRAHIIKEDFWGNRTIISEITSGELFGESYACLSAPTFEISVLSVETCQVLFMNVTKIVTVCTSSCIFHTTLIQNMLSILANKNVLLTKKMEHLSKRSIREKLLSYLSAESLHHASPFFDIPFNRQQLADYLSVDRSALSKELGKLKEEGRIDFYKNQFHLLK